MMSESIRVGDYVLATKFYDADPGDPWVVGFVDQIVNGRCYVVDHEGVLIYPSPMRAAAKIPPNLGKWLIENGKALEEAPTRAINLFRMLELEPTYGDMV